MTYTVVTFGGKRIQAVVQDDGQVCLYTGAAVVDRVAAAVTHYHVQVAAKFPRTLHLTLAQVTAGVMADIAAHEYIRVGRTGVYGTADYGGDAQRLANDVAGMLTTEQITGRMEAVYAERHELAARPAAELLVDPAQ